MNRISVFLWVLKVLESCETFKQLNAMTKLIQLNYNLYEDIGIYIYLCSLVETKWNDYRNELEQANLEITQHLEQ